MKGEHIKIEEKADQYLLHITLSGNYSKNELEILPNLIFKSFLKYRSNKLLIDTTKIDNILIDDKLSLLFGLQLAEIFKNENLEIMLDGNNEIFNSIVVDSAAENGLKIIQL